MILHLTMSQNFNTRTGAGLRITHLEGGGAYNAPLLSRLLEKSPNLGGKKTRIRIISGANFMTLDQHFQGKMASSMQNFRHFWLNVHTGHRFSWPSRLRQIASIR